MAHFDPEEAACLACGSWAGETPGSPLNDFAFDTRLLRPGDTFVALKGASRDGHGFLAEAARLGALAAVVEEPDPGVELPQLVVENSLQALHSLAGAWREQFASTIVGITGSFGKTTVKELLANLLGSIWFRSPGNFNNHLGVPMSLLELDPRHHAGALIEAGINGPGEMAVLGELIQPDLVIITAVGPAHLEQLGSLDGVADEKSVLAHCAAKGADVFFPASLLAYGAFQRLPGHLRLHALAEIGEAVPEAASGMKNLNVYRYQWINARSSRGMGELVTRPPISPGRFSFSAGSPGMVSNLALVAHVALHLGVPAITLQDRLDAWRPFRHRGEVRRFGAAEYFVDCYNANPGSMVDSARRFQNLFNGRPRLYVIGSMNELGAESERWHRDTGRQLGLDEEAEVFLIGHGAGALLEGIRASGVSGRRVRIVDTLDPVRERLRGYNGAVFLKASRSWELEQLLPGEEGPC